jgi:hypothetical protein
MFKIIYDFDSESNSYQRYTWTCSKCNALGGSKDKGVSALGALYHMEHEHLVRIVNFAADPTN